MPEESTPSQPSQPAGLGDAAAGAASKSPPGPLSGLRVLELASILAGPLTGQFLAELGAEVIKVENPATGGDPTRGWWLRGEDHAAEVSAYFSCANWGKQSLALDLASPAGLAVIDALVARSDIVLQSFKPGDDRKLGLDAERLLTLNPKLIVGRISAYGSADARPGFDAIIQAESGFTFLNGTPDGPPVKMPVALVDLLAAHQLKEAILLALLAQARGDATGRVLDVSLLDAAIASLANQASNYLVAGQVPQRMGSEHPNIVPYGAVFRLSDGAELVLAVGTDRQWLALATTLGLEALGADPRFVTNQGRVQHRAELGAALDTAFAVLDRATADKLLRASRVPFGFVNDMREVFAQPQAEPLLLEGGGLQGVRSFVAQGLFRALPLLPPPAFNADGAAVLRRVLGYDDERLTALRTAGVWPG